MAESKFVPTNEHLSEAKSLKAIFEEHKVRLKLSHRSLAADYNVSQSSISGYFNCYAPLNLKCAAFLSSKLQVPISAFSERLSAEAEVIFSFLSVTPQIMSRSDEIRSSLRVRSQAAIISLTNAVFENALFEPEVQTLENIVARLDR